MTAIFRAKYALVLCFALSGCFHTTPPATQQNCDPCIYVADQLSRDITVINAATNQLVHRIPAGRIPQFLSVSPDNTRVFVSTHAGVQDGLVTVIDTTNYEIVANIAVGKNPTGLVANPAGTRLYVLNSGDNTMSIIDTVAFSVVGTVPVAPSPYEVVISTDGTRLYISSENLGNIQVLDTATNSQIGGLIAAGQTATGLALNAAGTQLYVADFRGGVVAVIDTVAHQRVATIPAGAGAIALALNSTGSRLYTANFGSGVGVSVSVIDTAAGSSTGSFNVGRGPHAVVVDATDAKLYSANQRSDTVSSANLVSGTSIAIPVGVRPTGIALIHSGNTTVPGTPKHFVSAVIGRPRFDPGARHEVNPDDVVEFTVRPSLFLPGAPTQIRYYLNPNLEFLSAAHGTSSTGVCRPVTTTLPLPNGIQSGAQRLDCDLQNDGQPLIISAKTVNQLPPRDDPYAAVACFAPGFSDCVPVRMAINPVLERVSSVGPQRTAIILVNGPGAPPHRYADKAATASIFYAADNPGSARSFISQASHGLTTIVGRNPNSEGDATDIYGPYTAATSFCNFNAIDLADPDIDYNDYERFVILTNSSGCPAAGGISETVPIDRVTDEGTFAMTRSTIHGLSFGDTTLNGQIGAEALHEYGHALGRSHGGTWDCGTVRQAPDGCFSNSLAPPINLVNQGGQYPHPNSVHKEHFGWLEGGRILPVWNSGTYTIQPYEDGDENVKVLKIPRKLRRVDSALGPAEGYYYLSYRQPIAPWADWITNSTNFASGLAIHVDEWGSLNDGALLDMTPNSATGTADARDGALLPGQSFTDPLAGVSITLTAITPTEATVDVTITPRTTRYVQAAMAVTSLAPISIPDVGTVTGGGSAPFGLPFTLTATAAPGWDFIGWSKFEGSSKPIPVSASNPYLSFLGRDQVLWARFKPGPPPNDDFTGAENISVLPAQFSLFTAGAGRESGEILPAAICGSGVGRGRTVWYRYTPASNHDLRIGTNGSKGAVDIAVYAGSAITSLTPIPGACDIWLLTQKAEVNLSVVAGTTYYVQFDTPGAEMMFDFSVP